MGTPASVTSGRLLRFRTLYLWSASSGNSPFLFRLSVVALRVPSGLRARSRALHLNGGTAVDPASPASCHSSKGQTEPQYPISLLHSQFCEGGLWFARERTLTVNGVKVKRRRVLEEQVGPHLLVLDELLHERHNLLIDDHGPVVEPKVDDGDVLLADDGLHEVEFRLHLLSLVEPDEADSGAVLHVDAARDAREVRIGRVVLAEWPRDLEHPVVLPVNDTGRA